MILLLVNLGCKPEIEEKVQKDNFKNISDTLKIRVDFKEKRIVGLNFYDSLLNNVFIEFRNNTDSNSAIWQKTFNPEPTRNRVFFNRFTNRKNGIFSTHYNHFFMDKEIDSIFLENNYDRNLVLLENNGSFQIDKDIYLKYEELNFKIVKTKSPKEDLLNHLELVHSEIKKKYAELTGWQKDYLLEINDYHYYDKLQKIDPENLEPDKFIQNMRDPIFGLTLASLLYNHVKNRVSEFAYSSLNTENFSSQYINLVALGAYRFLKHDVNLANQEFNKARQWLKETSWYKGNPELIFNSITQTDKAEFKNLLRNLTVSDIEMKKQSITTIIDKYSSNYYLIDFWATWCKPCIEGVKIMKKMDLPENITVVSLSLDRSDKSDKWKEMTMKLDQNVTYLVVEDEHLKKFVDYMGLQAIPRYMVIDADMNLINEAFLAPHEPNFTKELKALR